METKRCPKCEDDKALSRFAKGDRNGLQVYCKDCNKEYRDNRNKEEVSTYNKSYREKNREEILAVQKTHRDKDKVAYAEQQKKNREKNGAVIRAGKTKYHRRRLQADTTYRVLCYLRTSLYKCLRGTGAVKSSATINLVGCTKEELMIHIQKGFRSGSYKGIEYTMEWNNYGPVFHIDHIRPVTSFDFSDPGQQKDCFHYKNLQPLFWWENIKKSNQYKEAF